jgi:hypothetical protein
VWTDLSEWAQLTLECSHTVTEIKSLKYGIRLLSSCSSDVCHQHHPVSEWDGAVGLGNTLNLFKNQAPSFRLGIYGSMTQGASWQVVSSDGLRAVPDAV